MDFQEELKDRVLNGLAVDIFTAERSYEIFSSIGKQGEMIQKAPGFSELFKATQGAYKDQFLLATARLFDTPSKKYQTICVKELLEFLSENVSSLPAIAQRPNLVRSMIDMKFDPLTIKIAETGHNDVKLALMIVEHFQGVLSSERNLVILEKLKRLRDKRLAHNELVREHSFELKDTIEPVSFRDFKTLVDIAKNLVGIIGWAYMSMVFVHEGEYHLTKDALRPVNALTRLIKQLGHEGDH